MCHNKHSHFAVTDIVHSGYCGLAISICVWQHTVAKTEVLKPTSWLPCQNTRQSHPIAARPIVSKFDFELKQIRTALKTLVGGIYKR